MVEYQVGQDDALRSLDGPCLLAAFDELDQFAEDGHIVRFLILGEDAAQVDVSVVKVAKFESGNGAFPPTGQIRKQRNLSGQPADETKRQMGLG